jgi:hypothetical protein
MYEINAATWTIANIRLPMYDLRLWRPEKVA